MKNDDGNVVSDAYGMKNIWRKYMDKLLNVENDWDGEVDCPEVMGPHCLISEQEVAASINGLKMRKAAGPTGVVSEIMKAVGGFGSRWMTDLYQLQECRLDTIYRRHRVRFRSDHHTHQHTHCQQNFHKHHTDGRQAEHTKGQDAQQLQTLARRHSMQNHSKK